MKVFCKVLAHYTSIWWIPEFFYKMKRHTKKPYSEFLIYCYYYVNYSLLPRLKLAKFRLTNFSIRFPRIRGINQFCSIRTITLIPIRLTLLCLTLFESCRKESCLEGKEFPSFALSVIVWIRIIQAVKALRLSNFVLHFRALFSRRIAPCQLYYDFWDTLYLSSP